MLDVGCWMLVKDGCGGAASLERHPVFIIRLSRLYSMRTYVGQASACGVASARRLWVRSSGTEVPRRLKPAPHFSDCMRKPSDAVDFPAHFFLAEAYEN